MCQITQALRSYPVFKIIWNHINCLMKTFPETNFSVKCVGSPSVAFLTVWMIAFCPLRFATGLVEQKAAKTVSRVQWGSYGPTAKRSSLVWSLWYESSDTVPKTILNHINYICLMKRQGYLVSWVQWGLLILLQKGPVWFSDYDMNPQILCQRRF